jgi:hypothetical protein
VAIWSFATKSIKTNCLDRIKCPPSPSNTINKGQLFGLKSSGHLVLHNAINKGQLFGLEPSGHLVLHNAINKGQLFGLEPRLLLGLLQTNCNN